MALSSHTTARPSATGKPLAASLHLPVLLQEVLNFFRPQPGQRLLDATLGLGGHSFALLQKATEASARGTRLLGLDRDALALNLARERLAPFATSIHLEHRCFSDCDVVFEKLGWGGVDFALADIGMSSLQVDTGERGFSFATEGPLDMRMDTSQGTSAATLVNTASVPSLRAIFRDFGEEPLAGRIARAIDDARSAKSIESTLELARIVERAYPAKWRASARNHPATRTFQALRMAVNNELDELELFLQKITPLLNPGGRVAVISFHSLEDRMVKHFFRKQASGCLCPPQTPVCVCGHVACLTVLTRKPILPSELERNVNPRACSAKLRVAEKLPLRKHEKPLCGEIHG